MSDAELIDALEDPCEAAARLRAAMHRALTGSQEEMIRYRTNEGEREIRYGRTNMDALKRALWDAENACALSQGKPAPRRRFAITAGSRRSF